MSEKHTPGPWRLRHHKDGRTDILTGAGDFLCGWNPQTQGRMCVPHASDMRLMAAAPDLLAACRLFIKSFENNAVDFQQQALPSIARAAIAKATGE